MRPGAVTLRHHLMSVVTTFVLAAGLVAVALVRAPAPASAECIGRLTPMPRFTDVAKDARRIVVGMVEGEVDPSTGALVETYGEPVIAVFFRLRVAEVLRGSAPDVMDIHALRTRAPITGRCRDTPLVYVTPGDERRRWEGLETFREGVGEPDSLVMRMVHDQAAICVVVAGRDLRGLDMSRAWLATVTHGPVADGHLDAWLVAPGRGGYPVLTRVGLGAQ